MKHIATKLLCLSGLLLVASLAGASTLTLSGAGNLALQIAGQAPVTRTLAGVAVSGAVTVTPTVDLPAGSTAVFTVDNREALKTSERKPSLELDTDTLGAGLHQLRVEVRDGSQLALSTGTLPLHVVGDIAEAAVGARASGVLPFNKLYRKVVLHEIIWFNRREADLEKHAFRSHGSYYITLTDLMRHIGGNIIWGPSNRFILVERKGVRIKVTPGSSLVYVNGLKLRLGRPCKQIENRTYVPVRQMLCLMGVPAQWNCCARRVDVLYRR